MTPDEQAFSDVLDHYRQRIETERAWIESLPAEQRLGHRDLLLLEVGEEAAHLLADLIIGADAKPSLNSVLPTAIQRYFSRAPHSVPVAGFIPTNSPRISKPMRANACEKLAWPTWSSGALVTQFRCFKTNPVPWILSLLTCGKTSMSPALKFFIPTWQRAPSWWPTICCFRRGQSPTRQRTVRPCEPNPTSKRCRSISAMAWTSLAS